MGKKITAWEGVFAEQWKLGVFFPSRTFPVALIKISHCLTRDELWLYLFEIARSCLTAAFDSNFPVLCQKQWCYMQNFSCLNFPETLISEALCQGFLAPDYLFYWNLSWCWCPRGGILIVWVCFKRHCLTFSPFSSRATPCPTLPRVRNCLWTNTDYEVCTDQEVCHGHSDFCLVMLLLKLDKM